MVDIGILLEICIAKTAAIAGEHPEEIVLAMELI